MLTSQYGGSAQLPEQVLPTPRARIAGRNNSHRARPADGKIRIVVRNGDILPRIVRSVDAVTDVGGGGQRLEPVEEARRNIEMPKITVIEQKGLLLTESERIAADIDDDVVNCAVRTADQFRLTATRTPVHSPENPLDGSRLRLLHKPGRHARHTDVGIEDFGIERTGEQAPLIAHGMRCQDDDAGELGCLDSHATMLP